MFRQWLEGRGEWLDPSVRKDRLSRLGLTPPIERRSPSLRDNPIDPFIELSRHVNKEATAKLDAARLPERVLQLANFVGMIVPSMGIENQSQRVCKHLVLQAMRILEAHDFEEYLSHALEMNAERDNISVNEYTKNFIEAMEGFAWEHGQLLDKVNNDAQLFAEQAAVAVGERHWMKALHNLRQLLDGLSDQAKWIKMTHP